MGVLGVYEVGGTMEVLVISKSFIIREAMGMFFNNNFKNCKTLEGNSLTEVLNLDLSSTEILFIDINIIDDICKLREMYNNLKVVVYNRTNNKDILLSCFKHKIESCISDTHEKDELTYIINTVKRGKKHYDLDLLEDMINIEQDLKNDDEKALTTRENEVLDMVGDGYTNKEIAKSLYISEHTVKKHITSILCKFDMRNRKDLIIHIKERNVINCKLA